MTETKKLVLTFKNGSGKTTSLTLTKFKEPVDPAKVEAAMAVIVQSQIFVAKDGDRKYAKPVSARIVTANTDQIVDLNVG